MNLSLRSWLGLEWNPLSQREKFISAVGGGLAIAVLYLITKSAIGLPDSLCVLGSMGASAVLLFAAPHGQLSQPWPVLMGHVSSAFVGVACFKIFGSAWWSVGLSVGLAIGVMQWLRCLHPPGGATALTAVVGGEVIQQLGFQYVFWPVLLEASVLVLFATAFNASFPWRRYPAILAQHEAQDFQPNLEEREALKNALRSLDTFVDLSEPDLDAVSEMLERETHRRASKYRQNESKEIRS